MGTKRFFESVDYLKHLSKYSKWRKTEKSRISNFLVVMNDAECECIVGRWSNQNRIFPGIVLLRKNSFQLKIPKSVVGREIDENVISTFIAKVNITNPIFNYYPKGSIVTQIYKVPFKNQIIILKLSEY